MDACSPTLSLTWPTSHHAMPVSQAMRIQILYAQMSWGQAAFQSRDVVCAAAHVQPHLLLYSVPLCLTAPSCKSRHTRALHCIFSSSKACNAGGSPECYVRTQDVMLEWSGQATNSTKQILQISYRVLHMLQVAQVSPAWT